MQNFGINFSRTFLAHLRYGFPNSIETFRLREVKDEDPCKKERQHNDVSLLAPMRAERNFENRDCFQLSVVQNV